MNALPSARGAESEGEEGCEEQGRLGRYIEGAQMQGLRAAERRSGRGLEWEGGELYPCSPPAGRETWAETVRALVGVIGWCCVHKADVRRVMILDMHRF